jgi:hypothetical protein
MWRATLRVSIQKLHDQTLQVMFWQLDRSSTAEDILFGKAFVKLLYRICKKTLLLPISSGLILVVIRFTFRFDVSQKETILYNLLESSLQLRKFCTRETGSIWRRASFEDCSGYICTCKARIVTVPSTKATNQHEILKK